MKIAQSKNKAAISNIREQIVDSADLDKFNAFLSKYDVIDFSDAKQQAEMARCCGGENCCQNVTISVPISAI